MHPLFKFRKFLPNSIINKQRDWSPWQNFPINNPGNKGQRSPELVVKKCCIKAALFLRTLAAGSTLPPYISISSLLFLLDLTSDIAISFSLSCLYLLERIEEWGRGEGADWSWERDIIRARNVESLPSSQSKHDSEQIRPSEHNSYWTKADSVVKRDGKWDNRVL